MAKETLVVKNFGPIREAELDLRKVTVFIGEQASGKSALAKLLAVFHSVGFIRSAPGLFPLHSAFLGFFIDRLKFYEVSEYLNDDTFIEFKSEVIHTVIDLKNNKIWAEYTNEKVHLLSKEIPELSREYNKKGLEQQEVFTSKQFDEAGLLKVKIDNLWEILQKKEYELQKVILQINYVPADRIAVTVANSFLSQYMSFFKDNFDRNRLLRNQFAIPFLNINYLYDKNNNGNYVILKSGKQINIEAAASGIQSLVPLHVTIDTVNPVLKYLFIIEEPELNLYPTTQKKLLEYLIEKCTKGDNRLIITTHSPYILTALNNCIQAHTVAHMHPESAEQANELVPPEYQIAYKDVMAYYVADGTAKPIMHEEFQMIDANALDDVSNELGRVFDQLLDLKYQNQD